MKIAKAHTYRGFTLVETAIAMGMVALMITAFMVAFGPAVKSINKSISAKQAERLAGALEHELSVVRAGESYATSFEKAFWWIKQANQNSKYPVLVYQYRGDPGSVRPDGTLNPYTGAGTTAGVDYVIQTSVRRLPGSANTSPETFHQSKIEDELEPGVLEGRVYYVRMTQLRYNTDGEMVNTTSVNNITKLRPNPDDTYDNTATPDLYTDDAVLPFKAEFYLVPNVLYSYISSTWSVASPGTLVLTKNMAVTR